MSLYRYPLRWPTNRPRTPAHKRKRANFSKMSQAGRQRSLTIAEARARLFKEIRAFTKAGDICWRINPDHVIISSNLILNPNGSVRAGQREPEDPGVAVYFKFEKSPKVFSCDRWDRVADNIAAIAAHLESMRGQERWGVVTLEQMFDHYAELPESVTAEEPCDCWQILGLRPNASSIEIKTAYWNLAKQHHPDVGGDREQWDRIQKAYLQVRTIHSA